MLAGRGSKGLPSTTASAKMLNAPFAAFERLGPRRESRAWRLFADRDVAFRVYRSWGRERALGIASRTMRCRLLVSVPTAVVAEVLVLEPADEMDVYIYGQLSGKAI